MSATERELEKAREYRARFTGEKAEFKRAQFSKGVEDSIAEASKYLSFFDIETGGLKPDSPIYEMGFMHLEDGKARFSQHFVNPTEIHTDKPGRIDQWTTDQLQKRDPTLLDIASKSGVSQKQAPGIAYREMRGRDVIIQNMRFEREALNARTGPAIFDSAARGMKLESFSSGRGLFPTNMAVKDLTAEASRRSRVGSVGGYLDAWEDVFTQGIAPMFAEKKEGVTRALDLMDLTKSVFAMAQKRNLMGNAGELFTGVSVGAFSKAMYGLDEAHIANFDNVLQGEMFHHFMGAGYAMAAGEELPDEMKRFFRKMSDMVPEQKQRNTVKNIIDTFKNQQEFLASEAAGAPKWDLLEGARINANRVEATVPVNVLDDVGEYAQTTASFPLKERLYPQADRGAFTTDIKQLVNFWEEDAKNSHGVKADYKAALAEAEKQYINPYREALAKSRAAGLSGAEAITSALTTVAPKHAEAIQALEAKAWAPVAAAAPPPQAGGFKNFIKNNWKIGLAGAGVIMAANLISGDDDDYNYIEGMRHGGISGSSRKQNTDFGSGWNALRGLVRAGETFADMLKSPTFKEAIENSSHVGDLGEGVFGKTAIRKASFRDQEFEFVRKTIKPGREDQVDMLREAAYADSVSESVAPNVYSASPSHVDLELFHGKTLQNLFADDLGHVPESLIDDAVSKVHAQGIFHNDLHPGNIMHIPEANGPGKIGIIDFGHFGSGRYSSSESSFTKFHTKTIPNKGTVVTPEKIDWATAREEDLTRARKAFKSRLKKKNPRYKELRLGAEPSIALAETADPLAIFETLHLEPKVKGRPASNVNHNTIEGFPGAPIAAQRRGQNTGGQFHSPWQGLRNFAADVVAEGSEQYALMKARQARQNREEDSGYTEGLNPHFEGDSLASLEVNDFAVEDADTIRMFMSNGQETSIRLAGIDAPEVKHDNDDGSRIWPDQPYGQEAKSRLQEILAQQNNLRAVIDPTATETYGRPVAMLIGDQGQNINLQLVREGMAASLPFGKRSTQITNPTEFNRAEQDAAAAEAGMWSTDAWQIARQAQMNNKRKITNVSYTDLGRLFSNFKAASILTRMRNPEAEFSDMEASGDRSDFNIIEGLKHGWVGANRKANLGDFGSGYQIDTSKIPRVPASYKSKKRVIEGQYLANTQLRRSMKRENVIKHYRG
jgi:endonuclease YncB( thermonuclease family)